MLFYIQLAAVVCGILSTVHGAALISEERANGRCTDTIQVGPEVTSFGTADAASPYVDYTHCRWNITGPAGTQIRLTFDPEFDVEQFGATCTADHITILDTSRGALAAQWASYPICSQASGHQLPAGSFYGPLCGQVAPAPFTTKQNAAMVQFCTDYELATGRWRINIVHIPIVPVLPLPDVNIVMQSATQSALITSPNHPQQYSDETSINYRITSTLAGATIVLKSNVFDLGRSGCSDTLTVKDITNDVTIFTACANRPLPALLEIKTTEVLLEFRSDLYDSFRGFSIGVSLQVCASNQFTCDNSVGCYNVAEACDGTRQCDDESDEKAAYCAPECGISHYGLAADHTDDVSSRIFGGIHVNRHSIPWQVSMKNGGDHWCGGSILTDRWILSAAHCYQGTTASQWTARVGGHNIALSDVNDLSNTYRVEKVICHPYYKPADANGNFYHDHDHCLVKLAGTIKFRKNVAPACLPRQGGDVAPGTRCLTSGWGETLISNPGRLSPPESVEGVIAQETPEVSDPISRAMPDTLRQTYVPIINRTYCATIQVGATITQNMICAGNLKGDTNICGGDSGGPLACQKPDGRWEVQGISSFGPSTCNSPGRTFVWARTGSVTQWIIDTISSQ